MDGYSPKTMEPWLNFKIRQAIEDKILAYIHKTVSTEKGHLFKTKITCEHSLKLDFVLDNCSAIFLYSLKYAIIYYR